MAALRTDIREAKIDSARAHSQIAALQAELKDLLLQIDATKLYIPGAKIQTRIETTTIPIANDDLLLIDCESIEIEGWNGPGIECVLEKTVLDEDGTKFDADFAGIKLVARKATGNEFFGFYKEMASRPGESEKALWNGFIFKEYIDHDLTYITVEGLTAQEGNRNISLVMQSEKGDGSHFRAAPACEAQGASAEVPAGRRARGARWIPGAKFEHVALGAGRREPRLSRELYRVKSARLVHGG